MDKCKRMLYRINSNLGYSVNILDWWVQYILSTDIYTAYTYWIDRYIFHPDINECIPFHQGREIKLDIILHITYPQLSPSNPKDTHLYKYYFFNLSTSNFKGIDQYIIGCKDKIRLSI